MVGRQVVGQYADHLELVAQLERQRHVARPALLHRVHVGLGAAELLEALGQARQAAAEDDALEVELHAQALAPVVQAPADAQAAARRVHAHFHAVEPVAGDVVARGVAAAGDLAPAVRRQRHRFGDAEGGAIAHHFTVVFGDELAARELRELAADHFGRIGHVLAVGARGQRDDRGNIGTRGKPHEKFGTAVVVATGHQESLVLGSLFGAGFGRGLGDFALDVFGGVVAAGPHRRW